MFSLVRPDNLSNSPKTFRVHLEQLIADGDNRQAVEECSSVSISNIGDTIAQHFDGHGGRTSKSQMSHINLVKLDDHFDMEKRKLDQTDKKIVAILTALGMAISSLVLTTLISETSRTDKKSDKRGSKE